MQGWGDQWTDESRLLINVDVACDFSKELMKMYENDV